MSGILAKGECPRCHRKVEKLPPKDRVTWRGPCPRTGCEGKIIARLPRGTADPTESDVEQHADTKQPGKKAIPRVGYAPTPEPKQPRIRRSADVQPGTTPSADPGTDPGAGSGDGSATSGSVDHDASVQPIPNGDPPASGKRRKWRWDHPYNHLGF